MATVSAQILPSEDKATAALARGKPCLLYSERIADLETPVSVTLKLGSHTPPCCLLESVEGGKHRGRFSIIALAPDLIWTCHAKTITTRNGNGKILHQAEGDALVALRQLQTHSRLDIPDSLPPMTAGLFGYFGYEMIQHMEKIPTAKATSDAVPDTPDAWFMRPTLVVVIDRLKDSMVLATPLRPAKSKPPAVIYDEGKQRLLEAMATLDKPVPDRDPPSKKLPASKAAKPTAKIAEILGARPNMTKAKFLARVKTAIDYIKAGDIFQVLLSQRLTRPFAHHPFHFYRTLRRLNPSPFLLYFDMGEFALVGSSPEILVRLRGNTITIRPIAGTRPRGSTLDEDQALAQELLADAKERAEHLMLLDLARNDTGRVAAAGSISLVEHFAIERYSHVMHIASEVEGQLRDGADAIDALQAGFPAGTVTGAPKIRAMEIIHELEASRRGTYAGAAGYIAANGDMDTCILLRTALIKNGAMHIQAGAGIVYDSQPEKEFDETINKAKALLHAAQVADALAEDR
ncbi:MAG: anthranilate synthase component I [Proteobacteria bacterium]|nr:anthranilate synthase component I [Pseudomonadota bacterium]